MKDFQTSIERGRMKFEKKDSCLKLQYYMAFSQAFTAKSLHLINEDSNLAPRLSGQIRNFSFKKINNLLFSLNSLGKQHQI